MQIDVFKTQDGFLIVRNLHIEEDVGVVEGTQAIPPDHPYQTWDSAWNKGMWSTLGGEPFDTEADARAFLFANQELLRAAPEA